MEVEDYNFIRKWIIQPDVNVSHVYQWLEIEPRSWCFLYSFGGKPLRIVHAPLFDGWSFGDPIPEIYRGLCRITLVNEKKGPAGNFRQLCICEFIEKDEYVKYINRNISDPPHCIFIEFINRGACH